MLSALLRLTAVGILLCSYESMRAAARPALIEETGKVRPEAQYIDQLTGKSSRKLLNSTKTKEEITIVVWDSIKGYLNWNQDWFKAAAQTQCSTTICLLTEDKKKITQADIILYHAPTYGQVGKPNTQQLAQSNKHVKLKQESGGKHTADMPLNALISLEQPKYAKVLSNPEALKTFDLIATYSLQPTYPGTSIPNLPLTYFPLHILSVNSVMQPPRPFKQKTGYDTGIKDAVSPAALKILRSFDL
jgi:hypothetical protein